MSVKLKKSRSLREAEILAFEKSSGVVLPKEYRDFVRACDGAVPESNIFPIGDGNDSGVNEFIPLRKTLPERKFVDHVTVDFLPVAWAEGGNYVCLELENGGVFFWNHEDPSNTAKLAVSFGEFLEMLTPFDVDDVKLKPGQVKKAWIDPDFLKGLE